MSPKTVGLIAHTGKPGAAELVRQLQSEFELAKVEVRLEKATAELAGLQSKRTVAQLGAEADLLVVLGQPGGQLYRSHDPEVLARELERPGGKLPDHLVGAAPKPP